MNEKIQMRSATTKITLREAFEKFIRAKRIQKLSKDTLDYYENKCYKAFAGFYGEDSLCEKINKDVFDEFIEHLQNNGNKSSITVNTHLRGLRAIINYFIENKYTAPFKMHLIKCEKPIKETYTEVEIQRLIKKPDIKHSSFAQFRNWAMVCYLLATGNRVSTMQNLKIGDIDLDSMEIKLKTVKNKKPYILPMSQALETVLREYLEYRKGSEDDYLFCTVYGKQLTRHTIEDTIADYNHRRGVEKRGIHLFRHTFAKNWIMNGGDAFRLQRILGHSSLEMVKEYVSIFGADLKKDYDSFSLLDQHQDEIGPKKVLRLEKKKR